MINNEFYKDLGEKWYTSAGDAVALLRQENLTKAPWVIDQLRVHLGAGARVLDLGCGGGFLTLELARAGYRVTGLDVAESVMASGRARDRTGTIQWVVGRAEALPFADRCFDAICVMDVLEHVDDWGRVVDEASRVLKPGGVLIYHTFNRTWLAWLLAARGLDWFLKEGPRHIHSWRLFIKPRELARRAAARGLAVVETTGIQPRVFTRAFWRLILTGRVPADFGFRMGGRPWVGYLGVAVKDRGGDGL